MTQTIGFIGSGKMAQAMIAGIVRSEIVQPADIIITSKTSETREKTAQQYGVQTASSNKEAAKKSTILFLGITPDLHSEVIADIRDETADDTIIVTIAAGITTADISRMFGRAMSVVRTMPNTPSLAGEGMTAVCSNDQVSETKLSGICDILSSFGKVEVISEKLMDAIPSISGSSPAYVYMMIEAMADGGVKQGLKRDQAYRLAAQAVLGAAKMVLDTELHPGVLKDQVCSPGGATIEAVSTLEKEQFRGSILNAMESCTKKVKELGSK
ncbi:pyrroline-5-carboxylate reductase [Jeotgalibacillus sp. S-D1]|uniref:pyrroline-5-carboxylate reductase n=1 Tax=Jeotgalibacillus sp. S-D1 TaxID=2552189 RepID=UPI00105979D2|nr:pyrroline-5-carboxylate reductase [Jeotgalibacillus sp. S-D1]TDL33044.1 pyrroline-5-carboxylate reductase [Jeotgalibacillus sp. S-D1]